MSFQTFLSKNHLNNRKQTKGLIPKKDNSIKIKFCGNDFGGSQIHTLLGKLDYIIRTYKKACHTIYIIFYDNFEPRDKMTYILLEYIICMLYKEYGYNIDVYAKQCTTSIDTAGLKGSLLDGLMSGSMSMDDFCRQFEKKLYYYHFRRMIKKDDDSFAISNLMFDIKHYLTNVAISPDDAARIAEIVSELTDNACEHAGSDCLVDIDIPQEFYKAKDDLTGEYYSVNICVINFSDSCLGDNLKNKIINKRYRKHSRYDQLEEAYKNHKKFFKGKYNEDCFFMISTFQNKISGRDRETETGGKGLTQLLTELETNICNGYVLSGGKVIVFKPELIEYNDGGWVGFNKEKDFINTIPDDKAIDYSETYLNGTGYNLTLIYRRQEDDGK